ncbi:MAG: PH domain-containing protein [Candidatus Nanopelagicales bacterium]
MDQAFAPPTEEWQRVSPRLAVAWRISAALVIVPVTVILMIIAITQGATTWAAVALAAGLGIGIWAWWLVGRRVRSYGYVERTDDLLVTSGVLFKRLVIVPYGRMQLVDLVAGPIDRSLGLATVKLHTAAATTDAGIPGLTPEVAARLRDRLAAAGEARSAGL